MSRKQTGIVAGLTGLILIVLVVGLALSDNGSGDRSQISGGADLVSADQLREAAADRATPIYWAGTQPGADLELSRPDASRTYLRYLTGGAAAGDPGSGFLTVATYAHDDPVGALRRQGAEPGGVLATAPGGATVYFSRKDPASVYLAYPGTKVQIEVYDPSFKRALQLVESGQIVSAG